MAAVLSKFERAAAEIEAARVASGLLDFRCQNQECGALMCKYIPPVTLVQLKCRRCDLYSELIATD